MKRLTQLFSLMTMALLFTWGTNATAQTSINGKDCIGVWKTVDDESGRTKSHVEIFKKGDKYYAKIIKLLDEQTLKDSGEKSFADIKCDKCPSDRGQGICLRSYSARTLCRYVCPCARILRIRGQISRASSPVRGAGGDPASGCTRPGKGHR